MKNQRGASLLELMAAIGIMAVVVTAFNTSGHKGINASLLTNKQGHADINYNNALERMASDIRSSYDTGVTLPKYTFDLNSDNCDAFGKNCSEITLKVPVVDGNPPTQYTADGKIKYGADGRQDCYYRYRVDSNTRRLLRETVCATTGSPVLNCNFTPGCQAEDGETSSTCPSQCPAGCGNGTCDSPTETCQNCPSDCQNCCPDGFCNYGETCQTCSSDCGACKNYTIVCDGDTVCETNENCLSCPGDCPACIAIPVCGDGTCNGTDNLSNCPADCTVCPDNICTAPYETRTNCPADCHVCGDGFCTPPNETLADCPADCKVCGDLQCTVPYETCQTCVGDCLACPQVCGQWGCQASLGETCSTCQQDCGSCPPPPCTVCSGGKTCANCQACCTGFD